MLAKLRTFILSESALSTIVAFSVLLVILTAAYAYFQVEYIPKICSSYESKHFDEVTSQFVALSAKIKEAITNDRPDSASIKLGGTYPDVPFLSTPRDFTGLVRSYGAEVRIQNAIGVEDDVKRVWDGSEVVWTGQSLKYTPGYFFTTGNDIVWEYGIVAVGKLNYVPISGKIIEGNTIFIPVLKANISDSSNIRMDYTLSVHSGGGRGILIKNDNSNIKIILKTSLPQKFWDEYWREVIDSPYVTSVVYNNGTVEITLAKGQTYRLVSGVVEIGTSSGRATQHYIYRLSPYNQTVPATLAVEVRDEYNNPVPNVNVTFSSLSGYNVTFSDGVTTSNTLTVMTDYRGIATVVAVDTSTSPGLAKATITRPDGSTYEVVFALWKT